MPRALTIIPVGSQIVDRDGAITLFFRLAWDVLRLGFSISPTAGSMQKLGQTAALGSTAVYTTKAAGLYRISGYLRKTIADGVASSLTATIGWTETALPLSEAQAALVVDTTAAEQSFSKVVWADANTDLTVSVAYTSTTPNKMTWRGDFCAEYLQ